jgi:hypothetical protein
MYANAAPPCFHVAETAAELAQQRTQRIHGRGGGPARRTEQPTRVRAAAPSLRAAHAAAAASRVRGDTRATL